MDEHPARLAMQFDSLEQQRETASLGMWVFLVTEIMLFGGLFVVFTMYRITYPEAFADASRHLELWIGGVNTAVLLCSSLTVALAVHAAQERRRGRLVTVLGLTLILGLGFLGLKGYEYYLDFREKLTPFPGFPFEFPGPHADKAQLFFHFYWFMTGIHAVHLTIGCGVMLVLLILAARGHFTQGHHTPVEVSGLYWHFVDIVWVFLYPVLYLIH